MTIDKFVEAASKVKVLAAECLKGYERFYNLKHLDCGNIEFEVYPYKRDEFLQALPDDATDIHTYLQFCFNGTEWRLCVSSTIRHVGEYKKAIEAQKAREE